MDSSGSHILPDAGTTDPTIKCPVLHFYIHRAGLTPQCTPELKSAGPGKRLQKQRAQSAAQQHITSLWQQLLCRQGCKPSPHSTLHCAQFCARAGHTASLLPWSLVSMNATRRAESQTAATGKGADMRWVKGSCSVNLQELRIKSKLQQVHCVAAASAVKHAAASTGSSDCSHGSQVAILPAVMMQGR